MFIFKTTKKFRKALSKLTPQDVILAKKKFKIFKKNPTDIRLNPHPIAYLSALHGQPVYAIELRGNLRTTFKRDGNIITSLDIGSHDIYESLDKDLI